VNRGLHHRISRLALRLILPTLALLGDRGFGIRARKRLGEGYRVVLVYLVGVGGIRWGVRVYGGEEGVRQRF
jgi:hypothetical protein